MKLLTVDTCTDICGVCITDSGRVVAEHFSKSPITHTERLLPAIDFLFSRLNWGMEQLDCLAVVNGPGSFTGLRISLSVMKGFSFALRIPVVTANALEVAAHQARFDGFICPMMDARRGEIFTCLFEKRRDNFVQRIEPKSVRPDHWKAQLPAAAPIYFCGPGMPVYFAAVPENANSVYGFSDFVLSATLATIAEKKFHSGEMIEGRELKAAYLRPSDAERQGPRPPKTVPR